MRIQHNIAAMNSYRNYNNNISSLNKNLEKLSSGYKINRAGDDAAGLAISEKMRAQITGLEAATKNVKDGISLVKTAEGAMQEVQDMLNRMEYLATQSANGTYDEEVDRANLQKEVAALSEEIDRIADSANFNGIKLMDGSLGAGTDASTTVGEAGDQMQDLIVSGDSNVTVEKATAAAAKQTFTAPSGTVSDSYDAYEITFKDNDGNEHTFTLVNNTPVGTGATEAATDTSEDLFQALTGSSGASLTLGLASNGEGQTALDQFMSLFKVTDVSSVGGSKTGEILIEAKDPSNTATVLGIKHTSSEALASLEMDKGTSLGCVTEQAVSGDWTEIEVKNSVTSTDAVTIKIGDKEYTTSASVNVSGATTAGKTADLVEQLRNDGYTVQYKKGDTKFYLTDPTQLQEAQKGTQITNTQEDKWEVKAVDGTTGKTTITMNTLSADLKNTNQTFEVTYVDADGQEITKSFEFNTGASETAAAANLKKAMENDADFAAAFGISIDAANSEKIILTNKGSGESYGVKSTSYSDKEVGANVQITDGKSAGKELTLKDGETLKVGDTITVDGKTYQFVDDLSKEVDEGVIKVAVATTATKADYLESLQSVLKQNGVESDLDTTAGSEKLTFYDNKYNEATEGTGGLTLQIGDTPDAFNQLKVTIGDMHAESLGIGDIDISTQEGAQAAIDKIKAAINSVSSTRGDLGAIQNRLEHTQNNLSVMTENIQDAESTIRDTDVAEEMMSYTASNILLQSAQAMLAQANSVPQGVLQLLG